MVTGDTWARKGIRTRGRALQADKEKVEEMTGNSLHVHCSMRSCGIFCCLLYISVAVTILSGCSRFYILGIESTEPQRSYLLHADELQSIVEKVVVERGFRVWMSKKGYVETNWVTYSVGTRRHFFFWKKEWKHKTRLTLLIKNDRGFDLDHCVKEASNLTVSSETMDSRADKNYWNVVSRATEKETEMIQSVLDVVDRYAREQEHDHEE